MSFEELLDQACTVAGLPNTARLQLPTVLSDETQKMMIRLSPETVGIALKRAVDAVNNGATESVDSLVQEALREKIQ